MQSKMMMKEQKQNANVRCENLDDLCKYNYNLECSSCTLSCKWNVKPILGQTCILSPYLSDEDQSDPAFRTPKTSFNLYTLLSANLFLFLILFPTTRPFKSSPKSSLVSSTSFSSVSTTKLIMTTFL
ncbi:hypothetical protein L596_012186 [Steinernema carpocapsae]|uniref:Uncharacterized protein n=1 Tax=Steinernema carpocapsae TaxID=34508 RepID=A0A4U5NX36_STECR|nr:hypothetical protein L596_012186 [Steinernema carpocapsae]